MFLASGGSIADAACFCLPGQHLYGDGCRNCQPGTSQDSLTAEKCDACPSGKVSNVGAAACSDVCPAGTWRSESSSSCLPCPAGSFSSETGLTSKSGCTACADKWSAAGSTACELESCPVGTYHPVSSTSKACEGCPGGKYLPLSGKTSVEECSGSCPAGTYSSETGLIAITQCEVCPPGKYTEETGQSSCKDCPLGRVNYVSPDEVPYDLPRRHKSLVDCLV